ncbi:MAG: Double-motif homing endonuclease [Sphingomonadales bacterium]|nr:Double-motif homing endonuclease [Sphingomonadales bacterium]
MKTMKKYTKQSNLTLQNFRTVTTSSLNTSTIAALHPWFITGFSDAEACFRVSIIKNKNYKPTPGKSEGTGGGRGRLTSLPLSVRLYFQIGLHLSSFSLHALNLHPYLNKTRAFSTDRDNSNKFKPAVVYANADIQKMEIVQGNKGRSGVYR